MGVKRAVQLAIQTAKAEKKVVFTCGPLIHNPQAVEFLKEHGVESVDDWQSVSDGTMIIRAHGMPKEEIQKMTAKGLKIVDATCPHVVTSQKQIQKYFELGYFIIIVGDKKHPEILSLQSFAPGKHHVISSLEEAEKYKSKDKLMVIAQTTFSCEEFNSISEFLAKNNRNTEISNSICLATSERQKEIRELSLKADAVIIVGGKSSANTRRLAEIAREICPNTFHIETEKELEKSTMAAFPRIAISAGASTPDFVTEKVIQLIKSIS